MVDLSDYLDSEEDGASDEGGEAEDLIALKTCLKALADALASTNLAVLTAAHGDAAGATSRVQASVGQLKRFAEAFAVLDPPPARAEDGEDDGPAG